MLNREQLGQRIVSMLYDEISPAEKRELLTWLETHPDDRGRMEELTKVKSLLHYLDEDDEPNEPLELPVSIMAYRKTNRWTKWAVAAAACCVFYLCFAFGLEFQVGGFRLAFGPGAKTNIEAMEREIQKQLAASQLAEIQNLIKSIDQIQTTNESIVEWQRQLSKSMSLLTTIQDRKLQKFAVELEHELETKFAQYASTPLVYSGAFPAFDSYQMPSTQQ